MFADPETLRREREAFDVHVEPIAHLLRADDITDIMLNTPERAGEPGQVWVDRVGVGLEFSGETLDARQAESLIRDFATHATHDATLNKNNPNISCQAALGQYRFEASVQPASFAPSFVIRKYVLRGEVRLDDYVQSGELKGSVAEKLRLGIRSAAPWKVLVGGETGSGKTTFLHPLIALSGLDDEGRHRRILLIEDTPELELPPGPHTRLTVKNKSVFEYSDAIASALRRRPDAIIVGEIRDGEAAHQAVDAWTTGHQGMATIHAGSCAAMLWRLYSLCRQSPAGQHVELRTIASAVDLCVHLKRVRGRRVITVCRVGWDNAQDKLDLTEVG